MSSRKLGAMPLVIFAVILVSSTGFQTAYGETDSENGFETRTREIATAFVANDTDFLAGVYTDNFLMTAQSLHVVTKQQLLENQRFDEGTTFEITDWQMIRSGGTVVVLYKQTWKFSDGGSNEVQFTDVWVKEDGNWLILSTHTTQISLK